MADRAEVIEVINGLYEALRAIGNNDSDRYMDYSAWAIEDAIELLKAQEPVPPIIEVQIEDTALYFCGNCRGRGVGVVSSSGLGRRDNFCPNCGRAVKWDA